MVFLDFKAGREREKGGGCSIESDTDLVWADFSSVLLAHFVVIF